MEATVYSRLTEIEIINKFFKKADFFKDRKSKISEFWRINNCGVLESCGEYGWEESTWKDFHAFLVWVKEEEYKKKEDNDIMKLNWDL